MSPQSHFGGAPLEGAGDGICREGPARGGGAAEADACREVGGRSADGAGGGRGKSLQSETALVSAPIKEKKGSIHSSLSSAARAAGAGAGGGGGEGGGG